MNNYSSFPSFGGGNNTGSLSSLVILILIILQFNGSKKRSGSSSGRGNRGLVDNSILFIIALFFLSCCNTSKMIAC
ncbi:MAG TPA: hypothetical protein VIK72_10030 [Clostridiaceae bacterium]